MILNGKILNKNFEFISGSVSFEDGIFTSIEASSSTENYYIVPGLIDIHTHGCAGEDYMDSDIDGYKKVCSFLAENGTTTFLPTLLTASEEDILSASINAKEASAKITTGANIAGLNLEGPYFGEECIGANNADFCRKPNINEIETIQKSTNGFVKIISIDPTLDGAMNFINHYKDTIKISLGHTNSDFDTAKQAIDAGATNITHTFNGMKPMHHRTPNMLAAAFNSNMYMEIICDYFHVHPELVKIAYKLTGSDRLVLITDSLSSMGYKDGIYYIGGLKTIVKDGMALLEDGTICGGMTPLFKCVKNLINLGISIEKAFKCATLTPAKAAGIDANYGSIDIGKSADFLVLNDCLEIQEVYVRGNKIYG